MLDVKYYIRQSFQDKAEIDLFSKYFSKIKFNSLYSAKNYFSHAKEKMEFISSSEDREKTIRLSSKIVSTLEAQSIDYYDILDSQVFPQVNYVEVLADLNPSQRQSSLSLECPCCKDDKKKKPSKDNRDAYLVKVGGQQTGIIKCSRASNCGESTSVIKHIMNRDGVNFKEAVINISKTVGVDIEAIERASQVHIEDGGSLKNRDVVCEKIAMEVQANSTHMSKNKYGLFDIDFNKADMSKKFKSNIDVKNIYAKYYELSDNNRLLMIYNHIKKFAFKDKDRASLEQYFSKRGIESKHIEDVGLLKANKINELLYELKHLFGEADLVKFGVINEKNKSWRYMLLNKEGKYQYCDSAVFFMHDIYSDFPTNMEYKFFGKATEGAERKAVSMSQSHIVPSNYFGSSNNIESIKDDKKKVLWWTEAIVDAKSLEQMGYTANSLTGVQKHYNENIGYFKDKTSIIAFDGDNAGYKNADIFAKKLKMSGAENVFIATWDRDYGKDINELLISKNLDKIHLSYAIFTQVSDEEMAVSYDILNVQSLTENMINLGYKELEKRENMEIQEDDEIVVESATPNVREFMNIVEEEDENIFVQI